MLNLEEGRCGRSYGKELHCMYERDILLLEDLQPSDESLQTQQVVSVGRDIDFIQHHLRGSFGFLIALFTADYVLLRCLKARSINNRRQVPTVLLWIHYKTAHSSGLLTAVYARTDCYSQSRPAPGRTRSKARQILHQLQKVGKSDFKMRTTLNDLRQDTRVKIVIIVIHRTVINSSCNIDYFFK